MPHNQPSATSQTTRHGHPFSISITFARSRYPFSGAILHFISPHQPRSSVGKRLFFIHSSDFICCDFLRHSSTTSEGDCCPTAFELCCDLVLHRYVIAIAGYSSGSHISHFRSWIAHCALWGLRQRSEKRENNRNYHWLDREGSIPFHVRKGRR